MFYAQFNLYGSTTEVGMSNTWQVASFATRKARDAWVAQHDDRLDVGAITQREAVKLAGELQRHHYANGGHLAHVHYLTDDNTKFVRAW